MSNIIDAPNDPRIAHRSIDRTDYQRFRVAASFVAGAFSGYNRAIQDISSAEIDNSFLKKIKRDNALGQLNSYGSILQRFCSKNTGIHSCWMAFDDDQSLISIITIIDDLDFDLEFKIYQELYADLPFSIDDYKIDRKVLPLNGEDYSDFLPGDSKPLYSRQ